MTSRTQKLFIPLIICMTLMSAPAAFGQSAQLQIDYTIEVASTDRQLFHVTMDVRKIKEPALSLSLPAWTPGWYTIENYAKNILRFKVTDENGARLPHSMTRRQTWRVETRGLNRVKVEFDYRAKTLALNQAKITKDFAFFTGTQLFLMPEGHRNNPSTVRFVVPQGWNVASALKETSTPFVFTAPDYDTLVDAPTEMGNFDMTRFEIEGKPHYFLATPAGSFSKEKTDRFIEMFSRAVKAQSAIFGGLPYDKYLLFYFFARAESNAGGALEHQNSYVAFAPPGQFATPDNIIGTAAHEFFHVWNVKRIRPAQMWPYDYSRENEHPLLWVSEGFTNYYTVVSLYRAGIYDRNTFLQRAGSTITEVESNEARNYISPADSSTSTWLGYDTPTEFQISYYTQGQNLGTLLDLSILNDTQGAAGLDDVFRALHLDFYKKGKGFSTEDLISIINRLTRRDYHDFFRRHISGVEVPPYDTILGYAGYKVEKSSRKVPELGVELDLTPLGMEVTGVAPDSLASRAGLLKGDILVTIDGKELSQTDLRAKIGQPVKVAVKRGTEERVLDMVVDFEEQLAYQIVEAPNPTPAQLKIRERWLKR